MLCHTKSKNLSFQQFSHGNIYNRKANLWMIANIARSLLTIICRKSISLAVCSCQEIVTSSFLVANITDSGRETPNYERSSVEENGKISTLLAKTVKEAKLTKK